MLYGVSFRQAWRMTPASSDMIFHITDLNAFEQFFLQYMLSQHSFNLNYVPKNRLDMWWAIPLYCRTSGRLTQLSVAMVKVTMALFYDYIYLYGTTLSVLCIILPSSSILEVWCCPHRSVNTTTPMGLFTYAAACCVLVPRLNGSRRLWRH